MDDRPPASNRFVGRQRELAGLNAALAEAMAGRGRLVMLAGEPGIGKTRTAQELASHAETLGAQVLWGWCYEQEGAPPYWPWVQPIRSYIQQATAGRLRSEMGPGAADIAEVISEVRAKLPHLEPAPALEPEQARFRLFDSTTTFLKKAAESQPLILVLEDLHWADKPSLLLLQFLASQLSGCPMLVVGTYRDVEVSRQHPLSETLAQLSRLPAFMRLELKGLDREDTADFIQNATGVRPRPQVAEAVYSHTEGNPFFMGQVVRLLSERAELASEEVSSPEDIGLPAGVRAAIGQRLNRLSARCNETLSLASAIGRGFDFRLLRALSPQVTEDQLLEVIDEALGAHLIEGLPGGVERYQFSHALVQQTLSEALSASRRVRLHARIGEALEALYGADVEAHAAELAHHFAEAQTVLGRDKLVRYSLLAGERAMAAYAWEDALTHFQRGVAAKGFPLEGAQPAEDADSARLLFGLGRAQAALFPFLPGYVQDAVAYFKRAFQYYVQAGELDLAVAIAEYPVRPQVGEQSGLEGLVGPALTMVPPNSQQESRLLAIYGRVKGLEEGDYRAADAAFRGALDIASQHGDRTLEMRILAEASLVDFFHLRLPEALRKSQRALELSTSRSELQIDTVAHYCAWMVFMLTGDLGGARKHGEAMLVAAERLRVRFYLYLAIWLRERNSSLAGDWAAARKFSDRGLAVLPEAPTSLASRAALEFEVGEVAQAEAHLRRLVDSMEAQRPGPSFQSSALASVISKAGWITGKADRFDLAQQAAEAVVSSPFATPFQSTVARTGQALIAVMQGDGPACEKLYVGLKPFRGMLVPWICIDRALGLLAQTMGQIDKAAEHFEEALAFCRKAGYRPELAWTCHDYAEALLQGAPPGTGRGGSRTAPTTGDRTKALSLLDEALAISSELGMRPLMERVGALRDRVVSGPEAAPAYPDRLTQREVDVLRLIAAGKTDREIAEELFISVRTVSTHVGNILNKINAANRTEAAAYATRQGLA